MLEILGLTYNDLPPVVPVAGTISGDGETIGRGNDNVIILPDPMRLISRQHLKFILGNENVYRVRNIGSGNPVFVNGEELAPGEECPLRDHDKILVGGYVLQVAYVAQGRECAPQPPLVSLPVERGSTGGDDFLAELLGSAVVEVKPVAPEPEAEDESGMLDSFLQGTASKPGDIVQALNEHGIEPGSLDGKGDDLINGEDVSATMEELLRDPLNTPANQPLQHDNSLDPLSVFDETGGSDVFGDILRAGKGTASNIPPGLNLTHGSELDALLHLPETGEKPPPESSKPPPVVEAPDSGGIGDLIEELGGGSAPTPKAVQSADNSISMFLSGLGPTPTPKTAQPADDPLSILLSDSQPADSVLPPSASDIPASSNASSASSTPATAPSVAPGTEELFQAFIEGLGMQLPGREGLDKAFMHMLGQVLRNYTQGTVDLMAGRTVVKQAVRANVTVIAPERNNPLKFSPDGNAAVLGMFGRPLPGFMGPVEAIRNAFVDLRAHQIGVISGMQAALNHVLDRFDPAMLGDRIPAQGLIENILPVAHRSRLWGEYGYYFHALREKASDHFQEFFGEAFVEAYEKAILTVQSGERAR
ncbi:MAG: type VI secretion system-associated FHA domain protein TagH [Betaproteobacteria bacterium]|nr:type VI secretion system-associated FHA domain protein TagH [Betaproteobacteria bacterium]